jgi:hypothetical protein
VLPRRVSCSFENFAARQLNIPRQYFAETYLSSKAPQLLMR